MAALQTLPPTPATASAPIGRAESAPAAPAPAVDSFVEPQGAAVELFASLRDGDTIREMLERAGADKPGATAAAALVAEALPAGIPPGTEVAILLGDTTAGRARRLERLSFKPDLAFKITVGRTRSGELKLARDLMNVDAKPRRIQGSVGRDLFWSLRAAGVAPDTASEFLQAVSRRTDWRRLAPGDRFDLVVDHIRAENGESRTGPLLYAALHSPRVGALTLVRWTVGGETRLFDPNRPNQRADGFARPVNARVSSNFGYRIHPILRFTRLHQGVDFGARWGTPVVAAGDGRVSGAGWSGGYGRQVRIDHSGGVATSYSHLSGFAVAPGTHVRRGDIIGYVGSTGFSTGPHLHFEVRRNGRPLDPMTFSFAPAPLTSTDIAAIRARADQLRGV